MNEIINPHEGKPCGWIQWKGTDVCMDLKCSCGKSSHFDGSNMYYVKCCHCGKIWSCNAYILLEEPTDSDGNDTENVTE